MEISQIFANMAADLIKYVGPIAAAFLATYLLTRFHNTVKRRVGYDNYRSSPLYGEDVVIRLPTATGSECATIVGCTMNHIKIKYENGDIGGISFIDFDKSNYRVIPNKNHKLHKTIQKS